jgi:carboxyl-terminal processing protease
LTQNPQFRLIDENAKWLSSRKDDNTYNLNIEKFKKQQEAIESEGKKYKAIKTYKNSLVFQSLPYEKALMEKDSVFKQKRERWHETLSKDVYVEEALNILSDLEYKSMAVKPLLKTKKSKIVGAL